MQKPQELQLPGNQNNAKIIYTPIINGDQEEIKMEKLLEAIILATMPEKLREDAKEPICLSFNKEEGLKGEVTTTIVGPVSGIYAGLCTLLE